MAKKKRKKGVLSLDKIRSAHGSSSANQIKIHQDTVPKIPTSILPLNYILGGGLFYGKIYEFFGWESSGKSLLALECAVSTQKLGGVVLWVDAEHSFSTHWSQANGLTLDNLEVLEKNAIETMSDWILDMSLYYRSQLVNNEPILIVVDSIATLDTLDNLDDVVAEESKAQMGDRAKVLNRFYRERLERLSELGATLIMVNQLRDNVNAGMFGDPETTPGGKSTGFYASVRIKVGKHKEIVGRVSDGKFVDDRVKGKKMGRVSKFTIKKNKLTAPTKPVNAKVYFTDDVRGHLGFDKYEGLHEIALDEGVIKMKGTRYYYKDKMLYNGAGNASDFFYKNAKMRKKIISALGINTISKTKEKLSEITENLFPVEA